MNSGASIVLRIGNGDTKAEAELVEKYYKPLLFILKRRFLIFLRKRLLAAFFSIAAILTSTPASSIDEIYEGIGLSQPLIFDLVFDDEEYLLIRASQMHADYALSLSEKSSGEIIRQVSFQSHKGLDEFLLVERSECDNCQVSLTGIDVIDRASPYSVAVEPLTKSIDYLNDATVYLSVLKRITIAAEYRYLAEYSDPQNRDRYLVKVTEELEAAVQISEDSPRLGIRLHALTFLAETIYFLGDQDKHTKVLRDILLETKGTISQFRSQALFELAPYEPDIETERNRYDEGMTIATHLGDKRLFAMGANYKGINLIRDGSIDEGLELFKSAYDFYSQSRSWRNFLEPLHNLSWGNQQAGDWPASLAYATQLKLLAEEYLDEENVLWALYNLGRTYGELGDRFVAEKFLDEALHRQAKLPQRLRTSSAALKAYLLQERTQRLLEFGALDLAGDHAQKMIRAFEEHNYPNRVADAEFIKGEIELAKGNISEARKNFERALEYDQENNRTRSIGKRSLRLAKLEIVQGNYVKAAQKNATALRLLSQTGELNLLAAAFIQSIDLLHHLGASKDALQLIVKTNDFIRTQGREQENARFAYTRGLVSYSLGLLSDAAESLETARSIVEATLPKVRQHDLRRTYFALQKSIYELNVELMLSSSPQQMDNSIDLVESFKARTLEEKINVIRSNIQLSEIQAKRRTEILKKINLNAVTWYGGDYDNSEKLLSNTRSLSYALEKLEAEISESRTLNKGNYGESREPLIIPKKGELIAYYFTGEKQSWLWVITENSKTAYLLPSERKLGMLVENLLAILSKAPAARVNSSAWDQKVLMREISDAVLLPLKEHLKTDEIDHITFIPDGPLHGIPFSPLYISGQEQPLIANYSVSYVASLTALSALRNRPALNQINDEVSALIVADPISSSHSSLEFAPLPYTLDEARAIQAYLGDSAKLLSSEMAQKHLILDQLNHPYSFMHFATHGLLNSREPALSGLVFSASDEDQDIWLTPEISNSNIQAELVVLSACESSIGRHLSGEGLFSLSRAFIEGGASNVVGTLWQVQDRASAFLISEFYKYFLKGNFTVAKALQKAQTAVYFNNNNDWTDPYYWAGFQLQGSGESSLYGRSKSI